MSIKQQYGCIILGLILIASIFFILESKQTTAVSTCSDTDGGFNYLTKGIVTGGTWKTTGRTYSTLTDSCNVRGQLQEGFCSDSTHAFYVFKYCDRVLGAGYMCYDGACTLDSDGDNVPDYLDICAGYNDSIDGDSDGIPDGCDICVGYDDNIDTDSDGIPDGCDSTDYQYELCNDDFYLGGNISNCERDVITEDDFGLLAEGVFEDVKGINIASTGYTQTLEFQNQQTGQFLFTQDDDDAPIAQSYLFIDNSNNYVYNYSLTFDEPVLYDSSSELIAEEDLIGTTIIIQGITFEIIDVNLSSTGSINKITLQDNLGDETVLRNNDELLRNRLDVDGTLSLIDSSAGILNGFQILFAPDVDEVYLAEGDSYVDPGFERFMFTFNSIEDDDYETIEFTAGSTSAELRFTNNDGTYVEIPLAADAAATLGEASDEPIYWGNEAPTWTTTNQDELVYMENEVCTSPSSVVDCQGAMFLAVDSSQNAHLMQITNIDESGNMLNIDDMTYGTFYEGLSYNDGTVSSIATGAGTLELLVDEARKTLTFSVTGGNTVKTQYNAELTFVNTDYSSQAFEGIQFSEYNDGTREPEKYLSDVLITAVFDDVTDNSIELERDSLYILGSQEGAGFYDLSDTDDNTQKFMTWKGSIFTLDREDLQNLTIEHPEHPVYAVVTLESN